MSASTTSRDWAALVGRVMLAAIYVHSGFGKITGFAGTVGHIARGGWPMPEVGAVVAIVFELGGGLLLVAGYKARWVALALAVFTVVAGIMFHNYWDAPAAQRTSVLSLEPSSLTGPSNTGPDLPCAMCPEASR